MSRSRSLLFVSLVVLAGGCGARPDLLEGYGGGDGEGGDGAGASGAGNTTGTGASGAGNTTGTGASGAGTTGTGASGGGTTTGTGASGGGTTTGTGASGGGTTTGTGASGGGATTGTGASGGGTTTGTGTGTGTQICPSFGDPCTGCVATACPDLYCNCFENDACFGILQCLGDCSGNDPDCAQGCYTKFEGGISDAALLTDCAGTLCPVQCPGNGGSTLDDCTECILLSCDKEFNDCFAEPDCLQLYDCLTNQCGPLDLMCQDACYDDYDAGIAKLQAMLTCAGNTCPNSCN